jgi:hypothetical protein
MDPGFYILCNHCAKRSKLERPITPTAGEEFDILLMCPLCGGWNILITYHGG